MKTDGRGLFRLGLKRRKKEVRRMRLMMCIAVFFLVFIFLFQDNMNGYQMAVNYKTFGRWVACSESDKLKDNPYLTETYSVTRGSKIYTLWPLKHEFREDGIARDIDVWHIKEEDRENLRENIYGNRSDTSRFSGGYIGTFSPGMAEHNHIELAEGRFPENDNEIAMERSVLDALGQGAEIGSEISFYLARFDDAALLRLLIKRYIANVRGETDESIDKSIVYDYDVTTIQGRNEMYLVTYKLVGIVERYSSRWDTDMSRGERGEMPAAFLTREEFNRLEMSNRKYRFFDLKPEYESSEVWHLAEELMDDIDNSEAYENVSYALNRNAYNNPLWGNSEMYRSVTVLLTVISTCIIAYLMANYLGKRRRFFMRMREIGATTADVWKMAAYECVGSVIPVAALTFVAAYIVSAIVVFIVGRATGVGFFYVFSLKTMIMIIAEASVTIGASLLAALAIFGGRSLSEKNKALSKPAVKRIKKRVSFKSREKNAYIGLLETLKRDRIAYRLKNRLLMVISILICAIIAFCAVKTYEPVVNYIDVEENYPDFRGETLVPIRSVDIRVPIEPFYNGHQMVKYIRRRWNGEGLANKFGIYTNVAESIDSMPGMVSVDWRADDFTHFVTFEGKDEDAFFGAYFDTFLRNNQPLHGQYELNTRHLLAHYFVTAMERDLYGIYTKRNAEEYWERYAEYLDAEVADYDAFTRGEQVIAVADTDMIRAIQSRNYGDYYGSVKSATGMIPDRGTDAGGTWYGYKPSFKPGDTLTVLCRNDEKVEVTVAGIVPLAKAGLKAEDERFLNLFGSDGFMQRICDADGVGRSYNSFEADLDVISPRERVVNDLVNICADSRVKYENNVVKKFEAREDMLRSIITYGFFGLILAVMFFFVLACIAKDEEARLGAKYIILSRFGMTVGRMKKEKRLDAVRRVIPLVLAFPVQIIIRFVSDFKYYVDDIGQYAASFAEGGNSDVHPSLYVLKVLWGCASPALTVTVVAVFVVIYWIIVSRMDTEWIKDGEKHHE